MQLTGLHHVTAITARAAENVRFYTQVLGLRMVKKTVNQDDVSAYHLFYADAKGSPGTDVTFFDWPQTPPNRNGVGCIARISLRAPGVEALDWWAERLTAEGVAHSGVFPADGHMLLRFTDPEGQELELCSFPSSAEGGGNGGKAGGKAGGAAGGVPWERSPVPPEQFIRGLNAVTLMVRDLRPTAWTLMEVMGFKPVREYNEGGDEQRRVTVFATGEGGPGTEVHVEAGTHLPPGRLGYGGVHHVAFRTPNDEEHVAWQRRISEMGLGVTPVIDRFYFKSIYFREPGGILFEIATDGPGFATDEDIEHLGEGLALPPFLEPRRAQIEAGLRDI